MRKETVAMVVYVMVAIAIIIFCWVVIISFLGGVTKEYSFVIPDSLDDPAIIRVVEEKSWDCSGKEAKYKQIKFFYRQKVEELTKSNFGSANLVMMSPDGIINRTDALIGNLENKTISILVATQDCEQKFAQTVNEETQELTCEIFEEYECEKPEKYLEGESILTIKPFLWVH